MKNNKLNLKCTEVIADNEALLVTAPTRNWRFSG
jgi:hypothetical protein